MIGSHDSAGLAVIAAAATDVGCVRSENEDSVAAIGPQRLWAVADGMGGHARGAWASRTVCDAIEQVRLLGTLAADCERLADALSDANERIHAEGERGGATIGTTAVVLTIAEGRYACLWVGDSRIYLFRDGTLRQLTRDHSQVEELVAAGVLDREQARDHPLGNVVTRAIGVVSGLALDVVEDAVRPGDVFLLCSDGLDKVVDDAAAAAVLAWHPPEAACRELVRLTLAGGAPDNVSVVVVSVGRTP